MTLQEKINQDFLSAYKNHEEKLVSVLRMLKSEIKNTEIAQKNELSNEAVIQVIKHQIKQHKDTIEIYQKSGLSEKQAQEEAEIKILEKYLPKQLNESEIEQIVKEAISETGAQELSDIGKVIGKVMSTHKDNVDGATVSKIAKEILAK